MRQKEQLEILSCLLGFSKGGGRGDFWLCFLLIFFQHSELTVANKHESNLVLIVMNT